ncbi:hypothetical protein IKO70_00300 [bacterium]|nr:hypothetical protein [bacterium]
MIIPFSELKLYIADFEGKYISSFVNDLAHDGIPSRGIVLAEAGNRTLYVLISDGRAVISKVLAFSGEGDLVTDVPVSEILAEKSVDLYLFSIENEIVFTWLTDFFTYPVSLYAPGRFVDVMKLVSSFAENKENALLCLKHGSVMNVVSFEKGNFKGFAYFDPDAKRYVFEKNAVKFGSYLGSIDVSGPAVLCKKVSEKILASSFFSSGLDFLENDPLQTESELYFGCFDLVFGAFAKVMPVEKLQQLSEKLFSYLRSRYPDFYSKLSFSAETSAVNWETMLDARGSVAAEYRFGEYHRYFDEILCLLLKTSASLLSPEKKRQLALDIGEKIRRFEEENRDFSGMFDRFDKLLKILR